MYSKTYVIGAQREPKKVPQLGGAPFM